MAQTFVKIESRRILFMQGRIAPTLVVQRETPPSPLVGEGWNASLLNSPHAGEGGLLSGFRRLPEGFHLDERGFRRRATLGGQRGFNVAETADKFRVGAS